MLKEALLFFVIASFLRKRLKLSEWRCEKLADGCRQGKEGVYGAENESVYDAPV